MTHIEQQLFDLIVGKVDDCTNFEMACEEMGLPEIAGWAHSEWCKREALKAGIPLSVIEGHTKLTDHFSQEYIDEQTGRNRR